MLKIHKSHSKKLLLIPIISICIVAGLLGLSVLTYTPNLSHAESVQYPLEEIHPNLSDITYMQDITQEICANTKEADTEGNYQYRLIDKRDSKTYWVAKLKDGNCWMTQNLGITDRTINSSDSDVALSSSFTIPASDVSGFSSSDQFYPKAYYEAPYGGYYNWYTASVGFNSNNSICPKGWKLPTGGDMTGDFYYLVKDLTLEQIISAPYNFIKTGIVHDSELVNPSAFGYYWSSTPTVYYRAFSLYFDNKINPSNITNYYLGLAVRCISRGKMSKNVEVTVNPTISLDVADEVKVEKGETNPLTADLKVKVSSNQPYAVKLSSDDAVMRSSTTSAIIPAKSGLLNTAENGWGIMKYNANAYTAITSTPELFYEAASPEVKELLLKVGISTVPDLPSGEYSTSITVTATQN